MLKIAPDAISASPYRLASDHVRTPSTVNALPRSKPNAHEALVRLSFRSDRADAGRGISLRVVPA